MVSADTGRERVTGHNLVELLTEVRRARAPSAVTGLPEVDFPCCVHQAWEEGLPAQPQAAAAPSEAKAAPPVADDLLRAEVVRPRCLPRCLFFRHGQSEHAACQPQAGLGKGEKLTLCDVGVKGLVFLRARGGASPDDVPHMPDLVHRVLTAARDSRQSRAKCVSDSRV